MSMRGGTLDLALGGLAAAQLGFAAWLRPAGDSVSLADSRPLGRMCLAHNLFQTVALVWLAIGVFKLVRS